MTIVQSAARSTTKKDRLADDPERRAIGIRRASRRDLEPIVAIDRFHSGAARRDEWIEKLAGSTRRRVGDSGTAKAGFVACIEARMIGYVFVEARAWEFGSPLCGWITAIGVDPAHAREGVAFALCREVCAWLRQRDIASVRTMVRRDAVEVLSFFRACGFRGGPYLELELDL